MRCADICVKSISGEAIGASAVTNTIDSSSNESLDPSKGTTAASFGSSHKIVLVMNFGGCVSVLHASQQDDNGQHVYACVASIDIATQSLFSSVGSMQYLDSNGIIIVAGGHPRNIDMNIAIMSPCIRAWRLTADEQVLWGLHGFSLCYIFTILFACTTLACTPGLPHKEYKGDSL